jgi:hypothetical protein
MKLVSKQLIEIMSITIGVLLEMVFSIRHIHLGDKKELSWESAAEIRSSKWAFIQELGSAREAEKMALWVQGVEC